MQSDEWFEAKNKGKEKVTYVDLCPKGMTPLSKAPPEKLTERQLKYRLAKKEKEKPKPKGCLGHETREQVQNHFRALAEEMDGTNQWDAGGGSDNEDSEWSESD